MDKQTRNVLIVLGISVALIWAFRPKNNLLDTASKKLKPKNKTSEPQVTSDELVKQQHNATVSLKAMREAINCGEKQEALNTLNKKLQSDMGIKIFTMENGLLCAKNKDGRTIAKEE